MRYSHTGDKQHRFSFRKLSVGLVSAVVASVFLGYSDYSVQPVLATTQTAKEQLSAVGIYHTTENELTDVERERVIKAVPVQLEQGDEAYYFVYRPISTHLPKTGELSGFASLAGIGFLVLVATYHRKRRQWLLSVALLSTAGTLLLSTDAEALTSHVLARFNQTIQLSVGDKLPHPTEIDGYAYVGYLKLTKEGSDLLVTDTVSSGDKQDTEEKVFSGTTERSERLHRVGTSVKVEDNPEAIYSENSVVHPVAFETQEVPSAELYEDERVTVQEGVAGERTVVTGTFTSAGKVISEHLVSDSVTLAPRPAIIHFGTKVRTTAVPTDYPTIEATPEAIYSEHSVIHPVAFETQEVPSAELYEDERVTVQEGVAGERTVVTGTFTSAGEVISEHVVSDSVTLAPRPTIIHVGTKVRATAVPRDYPTVEAQPEAVYSENSIVHPVAFETQEVPSAELYEDERVTVQEGVAGERTVVTGTFTSAGEVISEYVVSDSVTLAPRPAIIHVGTKVRTTAVSTDYPTVEAQPEAVYSEHSVVHPVAFETQEVPSADLYEDERVTVQEGLAGERTVVTGTFTSAGEVISEHVVSDSLTLAPRPAIIHVGTKVRTTAVPTDSPTVEAQPEATITVETQTTPYMTVYREDASLPAGEQRVSVTGVDGQKRLTKINGQVVQEETLQEVVTKEVSVGTQSTSLVTSLPFEIEYISDPTRIKGSENVIVKSGVNGQKTITTSYTLDTRTGQVTPNQPVETIVAPVTQIVSVGTKERDIPVLEIDRLDKSVDERSVTAHFNLRDAGKVALSAKAQLYKGDTLIKELSIPNKSDSLVINDLDYYTDYTLKTVLTYDLGDGVRTDLQTDTEDFRLDYKKIEIKDIDGINLYKKENDRYVRLFSLPNVPTQLTDYFVKIESDRFKDILLPVTSVEASDTNTYRVKAHIPELVQGKQDVYQPDFTFEVAKAQTGPTQYATFKELVAAIKANPAGTFHLSSDISASDMAPDDSPTYIPETFTGVLTGLGVDNKAYAIYDLAKPLFATISGGRVTNLDLKNVSIYTTQSDVAALAAKATNRSHIENVSVEGKITADKNVAGLVARTEQGTTITNTAFTGTLRSLSQADTDNSMGGIVAIASLGSKLSKVRADVNTYIVATSNNQKAGSLVGIIKDNSTLSDSHASGNLVNSGRGGQIGGVVGSTWKAGIVTNVLSEVNVTNGNQVHGDSGYNKATISNVSVREGVSGKEDLWSSQKVSAAATQAKRDSLGITTTLADSKTSLTPNLYSVDYLGVKNAQADRATTYFNVEKLMPFYNKELVVYYGNKLASNHKLAKVALVDVVPMTGNTIVTNIEQDKAQINRIMLHYADNTVDYLDVSFKETFANQHVLEYDLANTGLIYTPEELVSGYAGLVAKLSQTLSSVTFDSPAVRQVLNLAADNGDQKLSRLYLEEAFNAVQADLTSHLVKALAMNNAINTSGSAVEDYLFQKIAKDKEAFLLGLSYLQRWYNINYDSINTKDLSTYKFDFFGNQQASTIDEIIQLGKSGFQYLQANKNDVAYNHLIADGKQKDGLFNYLEAYRHLLTPTKSNSDWFKDNTKAYIVENLSTIDDVRTKQLSAPRDSLYNHRLYNRLTQDSWNYRNMVLPLLTLTDESVYVIPSLSTISFGGYERYLRDSGALTSSDPKAYVRGLVNQAAEWHRDHFDFWYKILTPETRDKLARSIVNYDGFRYPDAAGAWSWRTLDDDASSIKDFFGPVGKWYPTAGAVAYANGAATHFVSGKILERYGGATFTHEMVHNFDGTVYFEGHGRREGQGAELFAEGLLQSPDYIEQPVVGINHIFNNYSDSPERMHTHRPNERFNNAQDLQDYFKGVFDVMYLLDYAEAESLLKQPAEIKKQWFRKIENYYVQDAKTGKDTHAGNRISALTDEEAAQLTTLNSLIANNILARRDYSEGQKERNGYYTISLTSPLYAALDNPKGGPGDIMFRRIAFELLAAKGYHEGFLPYVSGKLGKVALAEGSTTWSSWYRQNVPLITDKHVFDNVLSTEYSSWSDFKQKMFDERIAKKDLIKPITIQYKLGDAKSTEEVTISSYSDLQTLIDQAVAQDLKNMPRAVEHAPASWVGLLKKKIYNAYLRQTNDFRESIFK